MKLKTTKKKIRDYFHFVIAAGYCSLSCLLNEQEVFSYCADQYGWNCDNYKYRNVCISTGYRPISAQNTLKDYDISQKYEDLAREVNQNFHTYEQRQAEKTALIYKMIEELIIVDK